MDKLQASEEFIRTILNTVDECFIVLDADFRIHAANRAYCKHVGLTDKDICGKFCYQISHQLGMPCYEVGLECPVREVFNTGSSSVKLHKHVHSDGRVRYAESRAYPLKDERGVRLVIKTIIDVTERHLLEDERLKTQKLESIGRLAGGIAHDFKNLLQGVFAYISMAKMSIGDEEKTFAMLAQAERALRMAVDLSDQLLTFAKGGMPSKKRISLEQIVKDATKFALSGSRCAFRLTIGEGVGYVDADEMQIAQVIQNIVGNACDATPDGGTIAISIDSIAFNAGEHRLFPNGGDFVSISIKDNGIGITEQHLAKIFDPYFTTKQKGSGLGLATSYSIIRNHDGAIDVKSEVGKGSVFTILLPVSKSKELEQPGTTLQKKEFVPSRVGRILVMDDDKMILDVSKKMIQMFGHHAALSVNGEDAVEKFTKARQEGKPFDLVILDLTIKAGMGGAETLNKLREIDPDVRAVVSSGYSADPILANYKDYGFAGRLRKPYDSQKLRDTINAIIEGK